MDTVKTDPICANCDRPLSRHVYGISGIPGCWNNSSSTTFESAEEPAAVPASTEPMCANCYTNVGTNARPYRDVCDTDRGDEIREGTEYVCNECLEELTEVPASKPDADEVMEELRNALRKLRNEITGWVDLEPLELSKLFGYTNVGVMRNRMQIADDALSRAEAYRKEPK